MVKILAIIGIIGGMLCAVADLLLDLKGYDNQKLGKMKIIDSKWKVMSHGRFVWSDILAMFAVPMYTCGFVALMLQLHKVKAELSIGMTVMFLCGAMGGFMIHTFLCMMPTVYQKIMEKKQSTTPEELCKDLPEEFKKYVEYTRGMEYEQDPDYAFLTGLLEAILAKEGAEMDYIYDWTTVEDRLPSSLHCSIQPIEKDEKDTLKTYAYIGQEDKIIME